MQRPNPCLRVAAVMVASLGATIGAAKDLGTYSKTYPIVEPSILKLIEQRLHTYKESGKMAQWRQDFKDRVKRHVKRPQPVQGVTRTRDPETFYYQPSFTLKQNVYDRHGHLLYPKGTTINPLDASTWPGHVQGMPTDIHYDKTLMFLNADDPQQMAWARHQLQQASRQDNATARFKIILVQGNVKTTARKLDQRVYFDQYGTLTDQFDLQHVPVLIRQDGKRFKIREYDVSDFSPRSGSDQNVKSQPGGRDA